MSLKSIETELANAVDEAVSDMVKQGDLVKEESENEEQKENAKEHRGDTGEDRTESGGQGISADSAEGGAGTAEESTRGESEDDANVDGGGEEDAAGEMEHGGGKKETGDAEAYEGGDGFVEISDDALTRAVNVGLPLGVARGFPSEDALLQTVTNLERLVSESETQEAEITEEESDPYADIPALDPEVYGEEAIAKFDKIVDIMRKQGEQIKSLHAQQREVERANRAAHQYETERWFDKQCSDLGEEYQVAIGKGSTGALSRGGKQLANREAIANKMVVLLNGYAVSGLPTPSHEEVFHEATKFVLGDELEKIRGQRLSKKLKDRTGRHIQRASGQKVSTTLSPEEEAVNQLKEKFKF